MNIQSNYPRASSGSVSENDMVKMYRAIKVGKISSVIIAILMFSFTAFPNFGERFEDPVVIMGGLAILLIMLVAITGAVWAIMVWVSQAHRAVCILRGITPKIPSQLLGGLSGIPYLFLFLPLCYALDFLVVRSASPDTPTMRWHSFFSKSMIVNVFAAAILTESIATVYTEVRDMIVPKPENSVVGSTLLDWLFTMCLVVAVFTGIQIGKIVMENIEDLRATVGQA